MMVDWVTAILPLLHNPFKEDHPLNTGFIMELGPDGDVKWRTPCRLSVPGKYDKSGRFDLENGYKSDAIQELDSAYSGSFKSTIQIKSMGSNGKGSATHIAFSGNPSKFLQGHNVFGSNDLISLMLETYLIILKYLGIQPYLHDIKSMRLGDYPLTRIDINCSYELPSRGDVRAWIRAAELTSKTRNGRPVMKSGTVYWGKSSSRWSVKAYSKGDEIEKHKLPFGLHNSGISQWADRQLRIELTLRGKELKERSIQMASQLNNDRLKELYKEYLERIDMSEQIRLSSEDELNLPKKLRGIYLHWVSGEDLRRLYSKSAFYRHRKSLKVHGIDITIPQKNIKKTNVVPLVRVLEAIPSQIPTWAFDQGLVHHSARNY